MTVDTIIDVADVIPIHRDTDARERAGQAYELLLGPLEQLDPSDWEAPTECAPWTVADMVGHLIGAAKSYGSLRELLRQQRHALRRRRDFDGNLLDAVNDVQVADHRGLTPEERVTLLRRLAPEAIDKRLRFPALLRRIRVPIDAGGSTPPGMPERLGLGHLMDTVLTRDVWLHRVDIARATGRVLDVDTDLDRRIVADAVAEWAGRHGQPFDLTLTGPAGGRFRQGSHGEHLTHDAVEFCRVLSGRAPGNGLLATRILF